LIKDKHVVIWKGLIHFVTEQKEAGLILVKVNTYYTGLKHKNLTFKKLWEISTKSLV